MSISSEISRISGNVSDSLAAVAAKGVTVPTGSNSDDLAGLIAQISGGGTGAITIDDTADSHGGVVRTITAVDISDTTATAADVISGKYFYTAAGVKTAGTASGGSGFDCPVFSMVLDPNTGDFSSITCDKTYAEALAYYNTGTVQSTEAAIGHVTAVYQGQTAIDTNYPMFLLSTQNNTLTYYMYVGRVGAIPYYQINYASNGTITWSEEPIPARDSTDLTVSGATVTAPAGYYENNASESVATGTAGTPSATKSAVSNHSISVTPSVTNTTGYITGSTKTGTAVTVSASELVSGSETKTANGTYDVTNLAQLVVNVASGSGGLVYEKGSYTPSSDVAHPTINFANSHTTSPCFIALIENSQNVVSTANSAIYWTFVDWYSALGKYVCAISSTTYRYAKADYGYKSSNSFSESGSTISSLTGSTTAALEYYVSSSSFKPYLGSTSRYFRSGKTYEWLAVWAPTT